MAAFLTASLVFLLVFSVSVSAGQRIIRAKPGENVILTCRAAENKDVRVVEWNRTDPESNQRVLLYRNSQSDPEGQSPSFINRVDLLDVENGDVSLVLKNVTTHNTGRCVCRVLYKDDNHKKVQNTDPICTINLSVEAGQINITAKPGNTNVTCKETKGNTSRKRRSVKAINSNCNNPGQRNITAEPGDNVILTCRAAENKDVRVVEWRRTDLESDQFVLLYSDNQFFPEGQSPSFSNRVSLLDVEKRDLSLVLKKVTTNDTGRYECRVDSARNNRRKRSQQDTEPISIFNLRVEAGEAGNQEKLKEDGGNKGGPKEDGGSKTGPIVGLSVFAVVAVVGGAVSAVFYKRSRDSSLKSKRPTAAAEAEETLTGPDE